MATVKSKQQYEALRLRARTDLFWLAKEVLGYQLVERVHLPVCEFFIHKDPAKPIQEQDTVKERLLLDPRGHFKTTLDICDIIQWLLCFPNIRILIMSGTLTLAKRMLWEAKEHFRSNQTLRDLFPEYAIPIRGDFGTQDEFTVTARTATHLREPSVSISTIEAVKASSHYDVIKCDDLVHEGNIGTPDQVEKTIIAFNYTTPLLEPYGYRDTIGTRYDHSDLYGWIIDNNEKGDTKVFQRTVHVSGDWNKPDSLIELLFPERFGLEWLEKQRKRDPYIFSCFPADSPVLMVNWSEKPIQELCVGDEIVGFATEGRRRLVKATVQHVHIERAKVIKATTDAGRVIYSTSEHKFLRPRKGRYGELRVGIGVVPVYTPMLPTSSQEQRDLDWLGGIIDGEGTCNGSVQITQSVEQNPEVCARLEGVLSRLGIDFAVYDQTAREGHSHARIYTLHGGRTLRARLLQHAQMAKRQRFVDRIWSTSRRIAQVSDEHVISIEEVGERTVYNIQSSSGNFVCQGYAVKNCQYLNDPTPPTQKHFTEELIKAHTLPLAQIPAYGRTFLAWDLGFSRKEYSDYSVGAVGRFNEYGQAFILDVVRGRFSPYELITAMLAAIKRWRPARMLVEKAAGSELVLPGLTLSARDMRILLPPIDWVPTSPLDKKVERIAGLHPLLCTNKLYFAANIPQMEDLIKEFTRFPKFRRNDIPDAISRLLAYRTCVDIQMPNDQIEFIQAPVMSDDGLLGAGLCG